jgi:hypothetical protein
MRFSALIAIAVLYSAGTMSNVAAYLLRGPAIVFFADKPCRFLLSLFFIRNQYSMPVNKKGKVNSGYKAKACGFLYTSFVIFT